MGATTTSKLRRLPQWVLVKKLRRAGYTQFEFAQRIGVSQQMVSNVIGRRTRDTDLCEKVWQALEKLLNGELGVGRPRLGSRGSDGRPRPASSRHVNSETPEG